ncbi:MAG: glycosyltransferase family 2 protein [Thermodesulfobacteriota bacterium]
MAAKKPSISIIVPCYNEAKNISGTVACINQSIKAVKIFGATEILIFNDKSTDDTGQVAEGLKKKHKNIRVIHNERNMGFGYNYTEGVRQATKDYVLMVPGDNEIPAEAIENIFTHVGSADLVIPYTVNPEVRPLPRRIISRAFVILFNALFGLSLRYYNGPCVIKGKLLKKVPMTTHGFAYMAAILVRLIKSGATFTEVPIRIQYRESGSSKAFRPRNIISVLTEILKLFWEVRVSERASYQALPGRIEKTLKARGHKQH